MILTFQSEGAIASGDYLAGHYTFAEEMRLLAVNVIAKPSATPTAIALEIAGTPGKTVILAPSPDTEIKAAARLDLTVPTGSELRWLVIAAPADPEDQAQDVHITLQAVPASQTSSQSDSLLFVRWVDGPESLVLWDYIPGTRYFVERSVGLAAGRAAITVDPFTVTIEGAVACMLSTEALHLKELQVGTAPAAMLQPKLEFWLEQAGRATCLGTLNASGTLTVSDLAEQDIAVGSSQFEFLAGGSVRATLGNTGLVTVELHEGET